MALNAIGFLLSIAGHGEMLIGHAWFRLKSITDCFLIVIPVSLTYAVLKHRLLDIHIIIRRGLRYVIARRVLQMLLVLPFLGLVLPIVANPNRSLLEIRRQNSFIVNLFLLALCAISLRYRKQLHTWLDEKFFRTHYRQEDILRG